MSCGSSVQYLKDYGNDKADSLTEDVCVCVCVCVSVCVSVCVCMGFLGGSAVKESTCNAGDISTTPGFEGKGNPL